MYYNVKIRFNANNEKIKADVSDTMTYDECVKSMHQYFTDHMDEDDVSKICVIICDASSVRCKVIERQVWIKGEATA